MNTQEHMIQSVKQAFQSAVMLCGKIKECFLAGFMKKSESFTDKNVCSFHTVSITGLLDFTL